ncbi:MAG: FAD:protein FMN transferase [Pirellulales bacterium]
MHGTSRRRFLFHAMGAAGACGLWGRLEGRSRAAQPNTSKLQRVQRTSKALGAEVSLTVLHPRPEAAEKAIAAAFGELSRIEEVMSLYRRESQLSRLNRAGLLQKPDPMLVAVMLSARAVSQRTAGAFDATVQPLWELYASAAPDRLPEAAQIEAARARIDWRSIEISAERIRFAKPGMAATLNGIAQGYAADRVLEVLRRAGIEHALVNTGELGALGRNERGEAWTAGIQHPRGADAFAAVVRMDGRAMATSGDYATSFSADHRACHIFDPATGRSPECFSSVTVLAPSAQEADAMSTAVFVMGLERGSRMIESTSRADAFFVLKDGRTLATRGFPKLA